MMWADRIGIGTIGFVLIGTAIAFGLDDTGKRQKTADAEHATWVAECLKWADKPSTKDKPLADLTDDDVLNEYLRPKCPPGRVVYDQPVILEVAFQILLFGLIPFWLCLRIIDFMFGGPTRRKAVKI